VSYTVKLWSPFPGLEVKVFFDMNSEVFSLGAEEERNLASFTRRLIEIAAVAGGRGSGTSPIAALNAMHLPAIALDRRGFVVNVNTAAAAVFDDDVKVKDKRLFVRDLEARMLLKASLDGSASTVAPQSLIAEPIIIQRRDKFPVIFYWLRVFIAADQKCWLSVGMGRYEGRLEMFRTSEFQYRC